MTTFCIIYVHKKYEQESKLSNEFHAHAVYKGIFPNWQQSPQSCKQGRGDFLETQPSVTRKYVNLRSCTEGRIQLFAGSHVKQNKKHNLAFLLIGQKTKEKHWAITLLITFQNLNQSKIIPDYVSSRLPIVINFFTLPWPFRSRVLSITFFKMNNNNVSGEYFV